MVQVLSVPNPVKNNRVRIRRKKKKRSLARTIRKMLRRWRSVDHKKSVARLASAAVKAVIEQQHNEVGTEGVDALGLFEPKPAGDSAASLTLREQRYVRYGHGVAGLKALAKPQLLTAQVARSTALPAVQASAVAKAYKDAFRLQFPYLDTLRSVRYWEWSVPVVTRPIVGPVRENKPLIDRPLIGIPKPIPADLPSPNPDRRNFLPSPDCLHFGPSVINLAPAWPPGRAHQAPVSGLMGNAKSLPRKENKKNNRRCYLQAAARPEYNDLMVEWPTNSDFLRPGSKKRRYIGTLSEQPASKCLKSVYLHCVNPWPPKVSEKQSEFYFSPELAVTSIEAVLGGFLIDLKASVTFTASARASETAQQTPLPKSKEGAESLREKN